MPQWFSRLPLTLRFPLAVAAMIFLVAVASTQAAIQSASSQFEKQMGQIGQVYLDGLSAALIPALEHDDRNAMAAILERSLTVRLGIEDRRLAILDAQGGIVAHAERADSTRGQAGPGPARIERFEDLARTQPGMRFDEEGSSVWVWRPLSVDDAAGMSAPAQPWSIVADLDVSAFIDERRRLRWSLLLFDLTFSGLCAVLGFYVARRLQRPTTLLTEHLRMEEGRLPSPVPAELIPVHDLQTARLIEAFNRMANDARQRETMTERIMEQERDALLGRMAATLAHEIRNPLGGITTAIRTLRKFGDDPGPRAEALDFIERGVLALQEVTDATLQTHRQAGERRNLRAQDLRDVRILAEADAARRDVIVELDLDMPPELPVAATEIRQVLLNLLLNAIRASAPGAMVRLQARLEGPALRLDVIDEGRGLPPDMASGLETGVSPAGNAGLGVAVIVRLVERLQGRVSVTARSRGGTHITLHVPLEHGAAPGGIRQDNGRHA